MVAAEMNPAQLRIERRVARNGVSMRPNELGLGQALHLLYLWNETRNIAANIEPSTVVFSEPDTKDLVPFPEREILVVNIDPMGMRIHLRAQKHLDHNGGSLDDWAITVGTSGEKFPEETVPLSQELAVSFGAGYAASQGSRVIEAYSPSLKVERDTVTLFDFRGGKNQIDGFLQRANNLIRNGKMHTIKDARDV